MSTVTLSKPHCATISAEKPEGIASHAFTTALPDAQTCLTLLFATLRSFLFVQFRRHCEERSDEAIQSLADDSGLLRSARNDGNIRRWPAECSLCPRPLRARCSLSPPRYRQARECRSWSSRRESSARDRRGSGPDPRRQPAWSGE